MSKKNKDPWYRQCAYETPLPGGAKKQGMSWIPEEFAKVGKTIYFGEKTVNVHTDKDKPLWTVTEVHERQRESFLVAHRLDWKHQREMSDI